MLHRMPLILLAIIATICLLHAAIPLPAKAIFYAMSLSIKSVIMFVLPVIIFSLLFKTMVGFTGRAASMILVILGCLCCSNYLATFVSHFVGEWIYHLDFNVIASSDTAHLAPAWEWHLPQWIPNQYAMFSGILSGILFGQLASQRAAAISQVLDKVVTHLLNGIAYLIPLFVAGFIIKLQYDGVIQIIFKDYFKIFAIVVLAQCSYLTFAYFALNNFNWRATLNSLKNMLPAVLAGFATMSSAAVLPITLNSVAENATNKDLARSTVSVSTNIHLLGDCIAIPIFAYALMKSFGVAEPSLYTYAIFTFYFVLAKFSVAAVPAGGIIVMLPVLESHLGFKADMLSLMLALYVLFDPVFTSMNILGNGALAKLVDRLMTARARRVMLSTSKAVLQPN